MELTVEQHKIINSKGDIKINAVAGSGKTTTIIEYAKARPTSSKILYLAFNKTVKLEAIKKFNEKGLKNVIVETAHSLAYKHIVRKHSYNVSPNGYKTSEIVEILKLPRSGEKHTEYIIANHINKFLAYFCNSNQAKVQNLNYLEVVFEPKAKKFGSSFYKIIEQQTRLFLAKMEKGEIAVTHDFYLKKFQLSNPILNYDYILFDEGQDASPAMLDVFFRQTATKVIVGDTHQQIYSWRYAVNSLEQANYTTFHLSTSFRFSQSIADLALEVLDLKNKLFDYQPIPITGFGKTVTNLSKAILARTNLGLLLRAIELVYENDFDGQIYFEGNINSYTYADEGASLYDVLSLSNKKFHMIRDKLIKSMRSLEELEEYIEKTEDPQLGMLVKVVKEYGNEIPEIINYLKSIQVENDDKEKAAMVFSTVHRSKGMEYDSVELVNDFINEEKIEEQFSPKNKEKLNIDKLNEEINLLYVAVTRTKNFLHIPFDLMPDNLPESPQIIIIDDIKTDENVKIESDEELITKYLSTSKEINHTIFDNYNNETAPNAGQPWTEELDDELTNLYCKGQKINKIAKHFGRTTGSIEARIEKLDLEDLYG